MPGGRHRVRADAATRRRPGRAARPDDPQVRAFLNATADDRWATLFRVAATTGMRRGEVAGLRWEDVDLDGAEISVRRNLVVVDHELVEGTPKGNRARRVSLDAGTVTALRAWRLHTLEERVRFGAGWVDEGRVFVWPDGSTVHPNVISRTFARHRDRVGLPDYPLHNLRHASATNALDRGVDVKDVSTRLGHSSTRITHDVYVAPSPQRDAHAAALVASLYDSP